MKNRLSEFLQFITYLTDTTDYTKMPYTQYLYTYHWRKLREIKLEEVDQRCQLCYSAKKPLHVHHRTYERLGNEKLTDLTVLCKECHTLFHTHRKVLTSHSKRGILQNRKGKLR